MNIRHAGWLVCMLLLCGAAHADSFEFKGLVLDQPVVPAEVEGKLRVHCAGGETGNNFICNSGAKDIYLKNPVACGRGSAGIQVCNGMTTIGGEAADANVVIGADGRLQRIILRIYATRYEDVLYVLKKKFGSPSKVEKKIMQNGFGAQFLRTTNIWKKKNGQRLSISKTDGSRDKIMVYFSTRADEKFMTRPRGDTTDI